MSEEKKAQTRIQSVSRAARILLSAAKSGSGLRAKEAADEFGLTLPTVYHLLNTLVDEGLLMKVGPRRYLLGPATSVIAESFNRSRAVSEQYDEALEMLAQATGETAYLSAWRNGEIVVLRSIEGSQAVRVVGLTTGFGADIHARASGKALLAVATPEMREAVFANIAYRAITPNTVLDEQSLRREIAQVELEGIAIEREEFSLGVSCISMPIPSMAGSSSCFTVSMPESRFVKQRESVVAALREAVALASSD